MRRDVSNAGHGVTPDVTSSLHAQRCFYWLSKASKSELVFSACAEMFPSSYQWKIHADCLLCMRRDVSEAIKEYNDREGSSLHAQRCF